MSSNSQLTWPSFLRAASISIATYDYLITIPAEWRIYRSRGTLRYGWSVSKILFILIRYLSIILLVISNLGYFYHGFSPAVCSRYYVAAPVLKVIQIMISQAIIGYRAWAITGHSKELGIYLVVFGTIVTALEWCSSLYGRIPVQDSGNCSSGSYEARMPRWVFYLMAPLFDAAICFLSTFYLIRSASGISSMSSMFKMFLYDGLGYMVILTAVNIFNLILYLYNFAKFQGTPGASLGYAVVWIMSQRIIIHIYEVAGDRSHRRVIITHQTSTPHDLSHTMRSRLTGGLDVQVQIEQAVVVDDDEIKSSEHNQWELSSVKSTSKTMDAV